MINTDVIEKVNAQFRLLISQIEDKEAEINRLRGVLKRVTPDPVWGEDPRTKAYYLEARAALQNMEDK